MTLKNEKVGDSTMKTENRNSKWTKEEINFLEESIRNGKTLEEIGYVITLRTYEAIISRANILGYGYYHSKNDEHTYFKRKKDTKSITETKVEANDFDKVIAVYQGIVDYHQNTIARLEKTKSLL